LLVVRGRINRDVVESVKTIILDEVNIQAIEYIDDSSGIVKRSAKANFKRLGSRLGKKMKLAAAQISEFGDEQITKLLVDGNFDIDLDGEIVRLEPDDIEISSEELGDWSVAQEGQIPSHSMCRSRTICFCRASHAKRSIASKACVNPPISR
jgi:isoleucyl-tRNA synthetase